MQIGLKRSTVNYKNNKNSSKKPFTFPERPSIMTSTGKRESAPEQQRGGFSEMENTQIVEQVTTTVAKVVSTRVVQMVKPVYEKVNDMEQRIESIREELLQPTVVKVTIQDRVVSNDVGVAHKQFEKLLKLAASLQPEDRNVWLAGPAGSGKTTAARQLAKALGIGFEFNGAIDTEYKLSGFIDAQGRVVSTAFRRAWENGGVYLFDECDASLPGALLAFNAALANGHAAFPDGSVERHPDCYIIAAANTWGFGGDANYVGRAKLDAAFLDRFVTLTWDYDEKLEKALAKNDTWVNVVQATRRLAREHGAQIVISPRASIKGSQLLAAGMARDEVVEAVFGRYTTHPAWGRVSTYVDGFKRGTDNQSNQPSRRFAYDNDARGKRGF